MFPTNTDLEFYRSKQPLPAWVQKIERRRPESREMIDLVVQAHAGAKHTSGEIAVYNLLSILRSYRRRKLDLVRELNKIVAQPGCAINPEKRAAFARKWVKRLEVIGFKMTTTKKIPEHVTAALAKWHAAAVEFDPQQPSELASLTARAAWLEFENECLKWERSVRAGRRSGIFGPTGPGNA